ncbi:hypothetical protein F1559_004958 [Cyanidiococcus yangmingshanensis]|uniref:Protein HIRA-like C-terminal domain-containing protein n=1 Tax=Cyanidiococcus yangmingshanensis TaxID=2690220 RepID=A0A7J7IR45_9RHOD|nr:hypothetical protein F1559_004958 [Cyanidiococcus yangmingshanensis]
MPARLRRVRRQREPACAPQTHPFDLVTVNGAVPTPSDQVRFENQREERLKDGKRRIIPVALGGSSLPVAQPSSVPRDDDGHPNLAWKRTGHHGTTAVERIKKRHRTHSLNAALSGGILRNTAATPAKLAPDGRAQGLPENEAARPNRLSAGGAPPQSSKVTCLDIMEESSGPDLPLDATAAEKRQVWVLPDAEADFVVESVLQSMRCTLVFGVKSGEQLWKQAVRGMISALAGSGGEGLILIGTTDAALHVFSLRSGMRLLAPLMLDAPVVWMAWHDKVVFALTRSASFYVYDVGILTRWRHELHLRPALCGTARFLAALRALDTLWLPERFLWNSGRRILFLFLGNGDLYAYIAAQAQWIRLMDDAFMASPYHRLGTNSDENTSTDVGTDLATLDKTRALMGHTDNNAEEAVDLLELADPQREISDTTAHLELLWLAASSLQNETEKRFWLHKLVKWLVQHGDEARLSELCDRLLDVGASNTVAIDETKEDSSIWRQSHLAMFDQIVLPTLAMNPELENMLNTYRELFKMLDAHQKEAGMSSTDESLRKP